MSANELNEYTLERVKTNNLLTGESGAERCDRKKALKLAAKRELVAVLQIEHGLSEHQACAVWVKEYKRGATTQVSGAI